MKLLLILVAFFAFSFPLSAQLSDNNNRELASAEMASEKVVPAHRDFIRVNTDTLFAILDLYNYFTNKKFDAIFKKMKDAWSHRNFEEFDNLCDNLGRNPDFISFLKQKKEEKKDKYVVRLPLNPKKIVFNPEINPKSPPPEVEDIIVVCDCNDPCVICFCPSTCDILFICMCFFQSVDPINPGMPGGGSGGGGFFCNRFLGGKPCAMRPPDWVPKQ